MTQNCQQFERRIQHLMDCRIDPETDEVLCAHSAACDDCHESMMAYSLLHTSFLKDSDSMKIKLENLGLQEVFVRRRPEGTRHQWAKVVASIATVLVVLSAIIGSHLLPPIEKALPVATNSFENSVKQPQNEEAVLREADLRSLVEVRSELNQQGLLEASTELPGLRPLKALAYCLNWFQQSWFGTDWSDEDLDEPAGISIGEQYEDINRLHETVFLKLASRS